VENVDVSETTAVRCSDSVLDQSSLTPGATRELTVDIHAVDSYPNGAVASSTSMYSGFRPSTEHEETEHASSHSPIDLLTPIVSALADQPLQHESPWTQIGRLESDAGFPIAQPLGTTEACLLNFFIDHISPWVCYDNL
jgi:hypothetical protein